MKNLLDETGRRDLLARIARLTPESTARWGRLNVGQMLCHLVDPMRIALGDLTASDASNPATRTLLRWMVLAGVPAPKGGIATFAEIDHAKGGGTPPTGFGADAEALRSMIARFVDHAATGKPFVRSPAFGRLSGRAYGRLMYVHMDHHLRQFGV